MALGTAQGVPLVRKPVANQEIKYSLEINMALFGETATYTSTLTEKITAVEANGNYSVEKSQSDYKVELFGEEGSVSDSDLPKPVYTYTLTGELVKLKSDLQTESVYRMAQMEAIHLPNKEVKKDDTWVYEVPEDKERGVVKAKAEYKVTGEETVSNTECWVVSLNYSEQSGTAPATVTGNVWLSKADASVVKLETSWNNAPIPGAQQPVGGSTKLERKS